MKGDPAPDIWISSGTEPHMLCAAEGRRVPLQAMGLDPLLLYGAGTPLNQLGWVPMQSTGGRIYCRYLAHPSAFYGAQYVWFCPTADPNLRGWVPFYCVGLGSAFYSAGLRPLSISGAGSPVKQWGWVPFYSMGPGALSISGARSPFTLWGWAPFYSSVAGTPFILWD